MKPERFEGATDELRLKMNETERRQMDEMERRFNEDHELLDELYDLSGDIAEAIAKRAGIELLDGFDYWVPESWDREHLVVARYCHAYTLVPAKERD